MYSTPSISSVTTPVILSFNLITITDSFPTTTGLPLTLIVEGNLLTVNVTWAVAALWVSLPANVAVTVYVPATRLVMLLVSTPAILKVTFPLSTPSIVPMKVTFPPTTKSLSARTPTVTSVLPLTVTLVVAVVALKLTFPL